MRTSPTETADLIDWKRLGASPPAEVPTDIEQNPVFSPDNAWRSRAARAAPLPSDSISRLSQLLKVDADDLLVPRWCEQTPEVGRVVASVGTEPHPLSIGTVGSDELSIPRDPGQLGFEVQANADHAEGVVVREILFALTSEVLMVGDVFTPHITRRDLGSPVVNLSGEMVGLNIGSHSGFFAYAIPPPYLREIVVELLQP